MGRQPGRNKSSESFWKIEIEEERKIILEDVNLEQKL